MEYVLNMENTQVGEGDRGVISRIMTRLTMAKLFQYAGKDISNFSFIGPNANSNSDDYYSFEERVSDILEFITGFNLAYDYDETSYILTVDFQKEITGHYNFEEALFFGWAAYELEYEYEHECECECECECTDEQIITLENSTLTFILGKYGGVPIKIMTTFYELLKENDLL